MSLRSAEDYLRHYENVSTSYVILAATDYSTPNAKIAAKVGKTIYIQKIQVNVTTDNAATQSFQDSAGTPIVAAKTKASPGIGPIEFDFGAEGFALTEGKSLDHAMSAAGLAGSITIQAYRKQTGVLTSAQFSANA
jgi:hypothetical protein